MSRIVFLGTPEAAVPALERLAAEHEVRLVVTQPDRPKGRSRRPQPPPVKQAAERLGLRVAQPDRRELLGEAIGSETPFEAGVVVAYGRILPPEVLELPARGFLNAHFSLLPRWRGAAPVERALMAGDEMTGVTIIELDEGLDTGPVLTAQAVDVLPAENAGQLTGRLAGLGARLLTTALEGYVEGTLVPVPQVEEGVTYAARITAEDRPLDIDGPARAFIDKVRALAPAPGATLEIDGDRHKILAARMSGLIPLPGTWEVHEDHPVVGVGGEGVALLELQPPGKNVQGGPDWARGRHRSGGRVG